MSKIDKFAIGSASIIFAIGITHLLFKIVAFYHRA